MKLFSRNRLSRNSPRYRHRLLQEHPVRVICTEERKFACSALTR